jgi:biofilm protein TabA
MNFDLSRRQFTSVVGAAVLLPRRAGAFAAPVPEAIPLTHWDKVAALRPLHKAFEALAAHALEAEALGRHDLDGDRMYATITQEASRDPSQRQFEAHRKYIDIHYLVSGKEMIGSADPATLKIATPYGDSKDVELFERPEHYRMLHVLPGNFAVFFTGQAHLPNCWDPDPVKITKIVIKVLASSLT